MSPTPTDELIQRPIGVFDSGVGGLTVAKAIHQALPHEKILYVGDTARVPYGTKSKDAIQQYTREILTKMDAAEVKAIVVACNTVSALAHDVLEERKHVIPMIDVLTAGVEATIEHLYPHKQGKSIPTVGVLGTAATISSNAYEFHLTQRWPELQVRSQACPLLVPLAEEGWDGQSDVVRRTLEVYLEPLQTHSLDAVILGCTHYPLFRDAIEAQLSSSPMIVDSGEAVAESLRAQLQKHGLERLESTSASSSVPSTDWLVCWVTDRPDHVQGLAERILGEPITQVSHITLG